ncbi:MAG: DUF2894 domain-containing protein [Parazoarcus communis]
MAEVDSDGPMTSDGQTAPQPDAFADLRARGAERFDPVGLRLLEAMARRTQGRSEASQRLLTRRLATRIDAYRERLEHARQQAITRIAAEAELATTTRAQLNALLDTGDFAAVHRNLDALHRRAPVRTLADLLAHIGQAVPVRTPYASDNVAHEDTARTELKAVRYFRRTWSRLDTDRQLTRAMAQAPDNAGPLNAHHLVLQALTQLQQLSPAYVERFLSYADTLLWLDQLDLHATQKPATRGKRKPARRKPA